MTSSVATTVPSRHGAHVDPHGSARSPGMEYRPALDGLRALAVLAVMAYHGGVAQTPGGFLGVDLFFVLSGFLITSLLLSEHARSGAVNLRAFWLRRARRLLPALFLVLAWVALYAAFWADPAQRAALRADALATALYVANWRFIFAEQSYFERFLDPSPLRHMWSLGIEEQWYLFWPLAFIGLRRLVGSSRRLPALLVAGALASAIAMAVLAAGAIDLSRAYYGTDARVQGLLLGAAAATFVQARPTGWLVHMQRIGDRLAVVGAFVLVLMVALVDDGDRWMYRGGFTLAALASLLLVVGAWVPNPSSRAQRLLAAGPLPAIGLISYGLYLWHWPTYVFLSPERTGLAGNQLLLVRVAVTFAIAICSYKLVERPIRAGALGAQPYRVAAACAVAAGILLAIAVATAGGRTAPSDEGGIVAGPVVAGAPKVLLVGDSIAGSLGRGIPEGTPVSLTTVTFPGCGLVRGFAIDPDGSVRAPGSCASRWDSIEDAVATTKPDVSILFTGAWEMYDHRVGADLLTVGSQPYADHVVRDLDALTSILRSTGARVIVLTPSCGEPGLGTAAESDVFNPERRAWLAEVFRSYGADRADTVTSGDLSRLLCPSGEHQPVVDDVNLYSDGVHYTPEGAELVWTWLLDHIDEAVGVDP